jgi:hypothetical protein
VHDGNGSFNALGTGSVNIPHQAAYALTANFSLELWFKRNGGLGTQVALLNKQNGDTSWALNINTSNQVHFGSEPWDTCASSTAYTDTNWHHVVVTWGTNGAASCHLYIDGSDVTGASSAQTFTTNTSPVQIGAWVSGYLYPGYIDEVAFYNTVLTPTQAMDHFKAGSPYAGNVKTTPGLVSYWRLGEPSGATVAKDEMGYANAAYQWPGYYTLGNPGAINTDPNTSMGAGSDGYWYLTPLPANLQLGDGAQSYEFWFRRTSASQTENYLLEDWGGTLGAVEFGMDTNDDVLFYSRGRDIWNCYSQQTITDNNWHHIVGVKQATNSWTIYVDGIQGTTGAQGVAVTGTGWVLPSAYITGYFDEIAIYNVALTPAQVWQHYYLGVSQGISTGVQGTRLQGLRLN